MLECGLSVFANLPKGQFCEFVYFHATPCSLVLRSELRCLIDKGWSVAITVPDCRAIKQALFLALLLIFVWGDLVCIWQDWRPHDNFPVFVLVGCLCYLVWSIEEGWSFHQVTCCGFVADLWVRGAWEPVGSNKKVSLKGSILTSGILWQSFCCSAAPLLKSRCTVP